jgi:restriction endonuclease S subunit
MKSINYKSVQIGEIFDFPETNSGITKEFCNNNSGEIPVYASSKNEKSVLGNIKDNLNGVKYYDDCLSWNRNGSVGYVFIRNHRFSTNEDHRAMLIKHENKDKLDRKYLKYEIEKKLLLNGFSFLNKCGVAKIKDVEIDIPIDKYNEYDLNLQKEVAKRYETIQYLRQDMSAVYEDINNSEVEIGNDFDTKEVVVSDIFQIRKGNAKYTKQYILNHIGEYPLYSSQTIADGEIGKINSYDYDQNCLTWTTDGIYAGTVFVRNGKFSMTTHCGTLLLKEEYKDKIDLRYVRHYLLIHLKEYAEGEGNKRVTVDIIKDVQIKIPINKKGEFDIAKQKEIAQKSDTIHQIKENITNEFEEIMSNSVDIAEI